MYYFQGQIYQQLPEHIQLKIYPYEYLAYLRVSTTQQEEDGQGPDVQYKAVMEYASRHGLDCNPIAIIDDISGDTVTRPGLAFVMEQLTRSGAGGILMHRPHRLARKTWVGMMYLEQIHKSGAAIHFTDIGCIANTDEARFTASIHFAVGELGKAQQLQHLAAARQSKLTRDKRPMNSGRPKYGWLFKGRKRETEWVLDEEAVPIVRFIYKRHREIRSIPAIADELTAMGVPTYDDRFHSFTKRRKAAPCQWNADSVRQILNHPAYYGKVPHNLMHYISLDNGKRKRITKPLDDPTIIWIDVPPIVTKEEWDLAQQIIRDNDQRGGANRKYDYLLTRRLKCSYCGSSMRGKRTIRYDSQGPNPNIQTFCYICPAAGNSRNYALIECDCTFRFNRDLLDAAVWGYVERHILDPEGLRIGVENINQSREARKHELQQQLAGLQSRLDQAKQKIQRLVGAVAAGVLSIEDIAAQRQFIDQNIQSYEEGIAETARLLQETTISDEDMSRLASFAAMIREELEYYSYGDKKELLRILGLRVTLGLEREEAGEWRKITPNEYRQGGGVKTAYITCHISPAPEAVVIGAPKKISPRRSPLWGLSSSIRFQTCIHLQSPGRPPIL